jgi:hypothetical protein
MNIFLIVLGLLVLVLGIILVGIVSASQASLSKLANITELFLLNQKPERSLLPEGWGLIELGAVIQVNGQFEGEYTVVQIRDDGQIWLSPV